MTLTAEKRLLQIAVAVACLVPVLGGGGGVWRGAGLFGGHGGNLDSHVRYLSGLLLAIGLVFAASIPGIERHRDRFRLLTMIVLVGGLARLLGVFISGACSQMTLLTLCMELGVTPLLCWWQNRVAGRWIGQASQV